MASQAVDRFDYATDCRFGRSLLFNRDRQVEFLHNSEHLGNGSMLIEHSFNF